MRPEHHIHRGRTSRVLAGGVPVALAGSIALALSAAPANAAETPSDERMLRALPASTHGAGLTLRVAASAIPATYTVRQGDTVSAIATRFGIRTVDLLTLNGLGWRSIIHPGDVLRLTGAKPAAAPRRLPRPRRRRHPAPTPCSAVTPSARSRAATGSRSRRCSRRTGWAGRRSSTPGSTLVIPGKAALAAVPAAAPAAPKAPAAAPAAPAAPAPAAGGSYKVKAGDTISSIASAHGVSVQSVLAANKLGWSSIIYPGQTIAIPGAASDPARRTRRRRRQPRRRADRQRAADRPRRARAGCPRPRHRDRARHRDAGVVAAQPRLGRPGLARTLPAASEHRVGHGSRGQRPGTGAKAFYGGSSDPNGSRTRGLLDIPGWQGLSFTQAAQAVQISAYPDAYAQWEKSAWAWLAAVG